MTMKNFRACAIFLPALSLTVLSAAAPVQLSREDGDRLERKIAALAENAASDPVPPKKTAVLENELNSYLNFNLREKLPRGVSEPAVSLFGNGNVSGRVFIDMEDFKRRRRSAGIMDPLNYISGRVPVTAVGAVRTKDNKGQFQLMSADIHGVPVPKPVVQELVTFFSRTPENPRGINIDEPFELPAKIRELVINRREATLIQ
jgi:hypothetical protein